jgi:dipeptidyl aminopeptidase/acylaminoacyl peptidase
MLHSLPSSRGARRAISLAVLLLADLPVRAAVKSPDDRPITDQKSIGSNANPRAGPLAIDELFYTRTVAQPSWSPEGKEIVFTTNLTGRLNLWKVAAAGGWPLQLAQSDDRQVNAQWSPAGDVIVYEEDHGGDECYDLFALPAKGGAAINLTQTPAVSETNPVWSGDGARLAFSLKVKTEANSNVALLDPSSRQVRRLTEEKDATRTWTPRAWSRDGRFLFAERADIGHTDSDLYRIDVATGAAENLTPHTGKIIHTFGGVSPDGLEALIGSNATGGFSNIALLDLATKQSTWVTDLRWETTPGKFSPSGQHFTYAVNEDGRTELYLVERAGLKAVKLDFPVGVSAFAGGWSPDGKSLLVSHQSSQRPADLWRYDVERRTATQLTFSALAGLDPQKIPPSQLVRYRSFDGKIISAFLWVPFNLARDGHHPGIVLPHGGPTGQTTDTFNRTVAALASRGYVVIAPNPRGSTGYGAAFQHDNFKDLGGGDLQDEVFAAKFLAATGYVDAGRVGITGGSYGGFMTLMALGKTPDVWAAGVASYGIINWFTMYEHEDASLQQYQRSLIGDPVADKSVYEACSPITHIHAIKAPLLVLQGDNDIRVPKGEAVQVETILKADGKIVSAKYYPNEGHGFVKRENQIDAIQRTLEWFDRYLKPAR